jgi:hypothetical protein
MGLSGNFKAQLVIIEGNDKGKTLPLSPGTMIIGRSKTQIVINDPRISREHVKLEFDSEKGTLRFTDLKSLNGCQLNGQPVASGEIKDGDRLQVGNTLLDCQMSQLQQMTELTQDTRKEPVLRTENFSTHENENEKYNIILPDGINYELNVNKYTSPHHGEKKNIEIFCGDTPKNIINENLPINYKWFYDEEIKNLVYKFYEIDIIKYNFTFDF